MGANLSIDNLLNLAAQQVEAGVGNWAKIKDSLQLSIINTENARHWLFDPKVSRGFSQIPSVDRRLPQMELEQEVFERLLNGELNISQAYKDSQVQLYGKLPQVLLYTRLVNELTELYSSNKAIH